MPALRLVGLGESVAEAPRWAVNNNFAFGGNNVSLVFRRE
jgi:3-oxoacyl-(acyl-carrier-protein) synthase